MIKSLDDLVLESRFNDFGINDFGINDFNIEPLMNLLKMRNRIEVPNGFSSNEENPKFISDINHPMYRYQFDNIDDEFI